MYYLILTVAITAIAASYLRFRDPLNAHFVFTSITVIIFCSDFLVRGYEDENIDHIVHSEVVAYQAYILFVLVVIFGVTSLFAKRRAASVPVQHALSSSNGSRNLLVAASTIVLVELLKRLQFSSWSITEMLLSTFGPRFGRSWVSTAGHLGDDRFLFSFIGIIFPLSGLAYAVCMIQLRGIRRGAAVLGYLVVLAFLAGDGSRTLVLMLIFVPALVLMFRTRRPILRISILALAIATSAGAASTMVQYRAGGYVERAVDLNFTYHQDDSYYRTITALDIAMRTPERWDAFPFLGASLLNMIPRAIWENKPTVDKDFWGSYKEYFVTITFLGEAFALFGPIGGGVFAIIIGTLLFLLLQRVSFDLRSIMHFVGYALAGLYIYMVMRSLLNLTQFLYMPLVFYAYLAWSNQRKRNRRTVTRVREYDYPDSVDRG